ncbi:retrovirus-related pol polyprotein from transposon TNT 1-94 [Tanacetum coccineum]
MTGDRSLLENFIEKFIGTVRFGNDHFAAITGYGDYVQGNITTCYVRNLKGDDLLIGARKSNLYTISISDMVASLPVCHSILSHLNFGTINDLTKHDLVDGLSKFKYSKDHLCSACEREKSKKTSHPPILVPSTHSKLELLRMDLCGMTVETINRKKYNKTPYELLYGRKPNVEYFYVFGSLCYPTNDRDDLGKMEPKADIGIFIGYSETSRGMDEPNITIEEYIRLEEEKARKHDKVYNWETAKYGKIWYDEDIHDLRFVETEFPAIAFNDEVSYEKTLSCEPMVGSLNNEIDFRISFDDSDDEDYMVIFEKNSFSYKIISTNYLKMDSENDNEKVNMPSLPSPKPTVSYFDDLDYFKYFEKEFPAIVYNDAKKSKLDFLTEPTNLGSKEIDKYWWRIYKSGDLEVLES